MLFFCPTPARHSPSALVPKPIQIKVTGFLSCHFGRMPPYPQNHPRWTPQCDWWSPPGHLTPAEVIYPIAMTPFGATSPKCHLSFFPCFSLFGGHFFLSFGRSRPLLNFLKHFCHPHEKGLGISGDMSGGFSPPCTFPPTPKP